MLKQKRLSRSKAEAPSARPPTPMGVALLLILVVTIAAPALTLAILAPMTGPLLLWVQYGIALVYATTSAMILWEAVLALRAPTSAADPPPKAADLPGCTAIVAAYLPNEQDIIVQTLLHLLSEVEVPADRYQVIVTYNTPHPLPVEKELRRLAAADPRLLVLPVVGSRSKAENVNGAIEVATGEIVAIFDADHWPAQDCFRRAWRHPQREPFLDDEARGGRVRYHVRLLASGAVPPQRLRHLRRVQRLLAA
jgi:cellulose synthase/poly-beta-1,6-N-acetylglucosamine synthase-like glycosyltransferase